MSSTLSPAGTGLPGGLLVPFHEVPVLRWDERAGTGRVEAVRRNRLDDWYYSCHFLGDPVMPGCWGVDAVWQCLRLFAAERGLPACRPVGMEDVRFFGQIRPLDGRVVYAVDVLSVEESDGDRLVTGRAEVSVDGTPVYSIGSAQVGTAFWEGGPRAAAPIPPVEARASRAISYAEFTSRGHFTKSEIVAIGAGTLVADAPPELGLLPTGLMLEVGEVRRISFDAGSGEGKIVATKANTPDEWHFSMNGGVKPAALSIDGVWQLMGLFSSWRGNLGTGRALGFERAELFGEITPADRTILYEVDVTKETRAEATGDAFVRADARVYADGRPILAVTNANVGCHKGIRYSDYPHESAMSAGGKVRTRGTP